MQFVNGLPQDSIDGVSMAYTFADAKAKGRRTTQFFDIMGSRGIYHDGWFAGTFGPRTPWVPGAPKGIHEWSPEKDTWELYNLDEDWTQANDLAAKMPEKVAYLKNLFLLESTKNKNLPIGGGLWTIVFHPEDAPATPYTEWAFQGPITRMPEFAAPKLGKFSNVVSMEVEVPEKANGVLYALGAFSGGLTCYVKDGVLCYEYNLFEIDRIQIKAKNKLPVGKVKIEVESRVPKPGAPMEVVLKANGETVAQGRVPITAAFAFTANDCLDIGSDLGSPVSLDYYDHAPFKFNGTIGTMKVKYVK
jgi:arylsulfatase